MREQMKRAAAAAMTFCMLPAIMSAPTIGVFASTESNAAEYSEAATFSEKLCNILTGYCGLYADKDLTEPVLLPVGSALNTWQTYYVDSGYGGWSGKQCYIYAQGVYNVLFGAMPGNGGVSTERVRDVLPEGVLEITPELLTEYRVMPGAYLRTTTNADLTFNGGGGHSMLVLDYSDTTITVLEGNADGAGAIELNTVTYERFNSRYTTGKSRGVCQIIQPEESYYAAQYGVYFGYENVVLPDINEIIPAVTTQAETTATMPETTTTTKTTTITTTTTTTTTITTTTTTTTTTAATTASTTELTTTAAESEPVVTTEAVQNDVQNVIFAEKLDAPVFLPLPNAEQYTWSTSNPEVVFLIWDGIAIAKNNGLAVITADKANEHLEFTICVDAINWETLGDVNEDGVTDPLDAVMVMNTYVNETMSYNENNSLEQISTALADVDGSGDVDLVDAQLILQYYVYTTIADIGLTSKEAWELLR